MLMPLAPCTCTGYSWTAERAVAAQPLKALDRVGRALQLSFSYIEESHNCTEESQAHALKQLREKHRVHYVLGGARQTAMAETVQVITAWA